MVPGQDAEEFDVSARRSVNQFSHDGSRCVSTTMLTDSKVDEHADPSASARRFIRDLKDMAIVPRRQYVAQHADAAFHFN